MLSTLSNLLPSLSSQNSTEPPRPPPSPRPVDPQPESEHRKDDGEHRKERARPQNETFIVVRPPPAMSNHPLNLQLQLIPPAVTAHGKDRSSLSNASSRRSMDFTGSSPDVVPETEVDKDSALRRSPSVTSDGTSLYSSASSSGSMSSLASSGSSRRIIVPLYNLSAHNVLTNTILDAGTDAKIAKFLKRGLEIIDLCVIEPTERWHAPHGYDGASITLSERVGSPVPSTESSEQHHVVVETTPTPAKRSRFNIFTRKDAGRSQSALALTPATPSPSKSRAATSPARPLEQLSIPVLGMQAAVSSPVYPPVGKSPASIAWVVRKWIKGTDSSLLANLRISGPNRKDKDAPGAPGAPPTVRFEWVRATARSNTADSHSRWPTDLTAAGQQGSRRSSRITSVASARDDAHARSPSAAAAGISLPASPKSTEFGLPGDASSHHESQTNTDAGDESDPEDSETPWTCTLVISASGTVSPAYSRDKSPDSRRASIISNDHLHPHSHKSTGGTFRLRLATLAPTPHHPKVVAQLKIPWPLPDVDVVQGVAHKRSPTGRPFDASQNTGAGLIVTAEEMKDIVCTTAFWMIVREGFGGVGKRTRKGDGWNIRG